MNVLIRLIFLSECVNMVDIERNLLDANIIFQFQNTEKKIMLIISNLSANGMSHRVVLNHGLLIRVR